MKRLLKGWREIVALGAPAPMDPEAVEAFRRVYYQGAMECFIATMRETRGMTDEEMRQVVVGIEDELSEYADGIAAQRRVN